jgi:hypothetical protein
MNIPSAKQSPRLVGGVLFFYYLDTFTLQIELDMTDQDGVEIDATGTVEFVFYDDCHNKIKEFTLTPNNNIVTLDFTEDVTALFHKGEYTYDVYYNGENRTTIANDNKAVVE